MHTEEGNIKSFTKDIVITVHKVKLD